MLTDKTQRLEKYAGRFIKVNYNAAQNTSKPSVLISGVLLVCNLYYEIQVTGSTWIRFTDNDISNVWDESNPYIELKV